MKAVLTDARFSDRDWIFERKFDGVRCVAIREDPSAGSGIPARSGNSPRVTLLSRNDLSMNARYPEVAQALESQPATRFAIDGEVVAFRGSQTSFEALAQRGRHDVAVFFYVFDITWLDGEDVRGLPLRERKRLLRETIDFGGPIRLTTHRNEIGEELFAQACRKGWEGLIAKRADSKYTTARSKDWLKFKCDRSQELVIGGFTPPKGSRMEFGALLVGHFNGGELRYAGKVGTGFDDATLRDLGARMADRRRDNSPFAEPIKERGAVWANPELVAQIGFTEWTRAGRLRHPRFLGLRFDKKATEVVREG